MWLRKVCSTVVTATWSSMVMVTWWLTIASGGSFLSSGMSSPAALAGPVAATTTKRAGRAKSRQNRMAHLRNDQSGENAVIIRRGGGAKRWEGEGDVTKGLRG